MKYTVAFPGRDAFYKGLDKGFYDRFDIVRKTFEEASEYLGEDLYHISYIKPEIKAELHTACLIAHCFGVYEAVKAYLKLPAGIVGFSHGEFTALAAAGSLSFKEVLQLIFELERLMMGYPSIMEGKMTRIVELDTDKLEECCRIVDGERQNVSIAMYISSNQNIISGETASVDKVARLAKKAGARWTINLNSTGAFHSPMCADILPNSNAVFDRFCFNDARIPMYSCVDGAYCIDGNIIKDNLRMQIAQPVMWNKVVENIRNDNIKQMIEIGAGCTVSANTRLTNSDIRCRWINSLQDLEEILNKTEYSTFM